MVERCAEMGDRVVMDHFDEVRQRDSGLVNKLEFLHASRRSRHPDVNTRRLWDSSPASP
jgi:hypothetical protein